MRNLWLLSDDALQVRAARDLRGPFSARGRAPRGGDRRDYPEALSVDPATGVATIRVEGVLTPEPDAQAEWYGEANTTYPDLRAALSAAMADESVREIVWSIDSPGGSVDGYFALLDDIADARAAGAKMRVVADSAQSAAYGIAAAAGPITATSRMSAFGSVGVATSAFVLGDMIGKVVDLTNTDAPEKRPQLGTPEGRAVVVKYLDQIGEEFMGAIAKGRGVSADDVAKSYGRGASMLAKAALSAGLIDGIAERLAPSNARTLTNARTSDSVPASMSTPVPDAVKIVPSPTVAVVDAPAASTPALDPFAAEREELAAFRAERDKREASERRSLITALVELRAETPAHAWVDGAPAPRLAAESLDSLRERVSALRALNPSASSPAAVSPPAVSELSGLSDIEQAEAAKIKDPEARAKFVELRQHRREQSAGA